MEKYLAALDYLRVLARSLHDLDSASAELANHIVELLEPIAYAVERADLAGLLDHDD